MDGAERMLEVERKALRQALYPPVRQRGKDTTLTEFRPFYSLRHARRGTAERFWHARRKPIRWRTDEGTDDYPNGPVSAPG